MDYSTNYSTETPAVFLSKVWSKFCRRGRGNQRDLTANMFDIRRDAPDIEYVLQLKYVSRNHQAILSPCCS